MSGVSLNRYAPDHQSGRQPSNTAQPAVASDPPETRAPDHLRGAAAADDPAGRLEARRHLEQLRVLAAKLLEIALHGFATTLARLERGQLAFERIRFRLRKPFPELLVQLAGRRRHAVVVGYRLPRSGWSNVLIPAGRPGACAGEHDRDGDRTCHPHDVRLLTWLFANAPGIPPPDLRALLVSQRDGRI